MEVYDIDYCDDFTIITFEDGSEVIEEKDISIEEVCKKYKISEYYLMQQAFYNQLRSPYLTIDINC